MLNRLGEDSNIKTYFIDYLINNYGFEGFHHYTDISNLYDIIQKGKLSSRNKLVSSNFLDAANQDIISHTRESIKDYVRFFYKENTPTTYNNEGIKPSNQSPHMPLPVLLLFDESIINHRDLAFLSGGGGNHFSKFTSDISEALGFDWFVIFSRGPIPKAENNILCIGNDFDELSIVNKRNAEFLYPDYIETRYIKKIIFRSPADKRSAESILGQNPLFSIDYDENKFHYIHNFLYDYQISPRGINFVVGLKFYKNPKTYTHELVVYYKDGSMERLNIDKSPSSRIAKARRPSGCRDYEYYFVLKTNKRAIRIEYLMNGHISGHWQGGNYD